jgi:hypothetical protein
LERRANPWEIFNEERPEVVKAFQELMNRINGNNVLDKKTMALIYVGIYSTIRGGGGGSGLAGLQHRGFIRGIELAHHPRTHERPTRVR